MVVARASMSVGHVIGIFSAEHGGPVVSMRNYAIEQGRRGHAVSVFTLEGYPNASPAVRLPPPVRQVVKPVAWPPVLGRSPALREALRSAPPADVYHLHGIWLRAMYYGWQKARTERRPYLIEINGALDPRELATKPWRKRVVRCWYQNRMLREAPCIHVNSSREARHVRDLGFDAPIAVIAAGFNVEEFDALAQHARAMQPSWGEPLYGRRVLLYLSRIHPAKGIDDLITAWTDLAPEFPDWDLLIVGPGNPNEVKARKAQIAKVGLQRRCIWAGTVTDVERAWAYIRAELYVLPSHKENFGNTVQEALGYGTPVVTTTQTPWTNLGARGCGWVCSDNAGSLRETLGRCLSLPTSVLKEKGRQGRAMILRDFSLASVVDQQLAVYAWLQKGPAPTCLYRC
jgi:glycosyltransferase involved in cell wall biosynthesis